MFSRMSSMLAIAVVASLVVVAGASRVSAQAKKNGVPQTPEVKKAASNLDDAEENLKNKKEKAKAAAKAAEDAQRDYKTAVEKRDKLVSTTKDRLRLKFQLDALSQKREAAQASADEAAGPVLEELAKTPEHIERKNALTTATEELSQARNQGNSSSEQEARNRVSELTMALKKFERKKLDEDPRTAALRTAVEKLDEQIAEAKKNIAAGVDQDGAVMAAEKDVNQSHAALTSAKNGVKDAATAVAAAESLVAARKAQHQNAVQQAKQKQQDKNKKKKK